MKTLNKNTEKTHEEVNQSIEMKIPNIKPINHPKLSP